MPMIFIAYALLRQRFPALSSIPLMCPKCVRLPRAFAWLFLRHIIDMTSFHGFLAVVALVVTFLYVGEVRGQGRPRFRRNGYAYETAADKEFKKKVADEYKKQCGRMFGGGPLCVRIDVARHLPRSRPKSVITEPDTVKPDIDNIAKGVLDALNGVAFSDDSQVVTLIVREYPRVRLPCDYDHMRVTVATVDSDVLYPYKHVLDLLG